jgi:DNA-binding NtrC family response regulator
MSAHTILVVDDDERLLETLAILVRQLGHTALTAPDVATAEQLLAAHEVDLVVTDLRMPGGSGLDLLERIREDAPDTPVILLTAYGTVDGAVRAMQRGAFDFVQKPFDAGEMEARMTRALEHRRMRRERDYLLEATNEVAGLDDLIGVSPGCAACSAVERWPTTSPSSSRETGTGKPQRDPSAAAPRRALLVPVNLAAIALDLLERAHGHVRGAFTGASRSSGKLELAHRGTLFWTGRRCAAGPAAGSSASSGRCRQARRRAPARHVDVRSWPPRTGPRPRSRRGGSGRPVLSASRHRDARAARSPRRHSSPLPRKANRAAASVGSDHRGGAACCRTIVAGNVRELENRIARAAVLCRGTVIGADLLDLRTPGAPSGPEQERARLDEALDRLEREMIVKALEGTKQVKARAARVLGISERSLWYKLRKHGLS